MAKRPSQPATEVVAVQENDRVVVFEAAVAARFAVSLGIQLSGAPEERADMAADHMSRSQRHMLAAGVLLLSVKNDCEHGQYIELIEERGVEPRSAQRAMQYATFLLSRSEEERNRLLGVPARRVLALAGADIEVVQNLLDDPTQPIDVLSVRALRDRIRELEARETNLAVKLETSQANAEGLRKRLTHEDRADAVPVVFADLRAEIVACAKKGQLAVDAMRAVAADLEPLLRGKGGEWADATLRLLAGALAALGLQLEGALTRTVELTGGDPSAVSLSYLTQQEVVEAAQRWRELVAADGHEKALREWEREQERPRAAGRPKGKPDAAKQVSSKGKP